MDLYRKLPSVWPGNPLRPVKKGLTKEDLPLVVYSSTVLSAKCLLSFPVTSVTLKRKKKKTKQNPQYLKLLPIVDILISITGVIQQQCQHLKRVLLDSVVEKLVIPAKFMTFRSAYCYSSMLKFFKIK
jgi:hypothetical protein